MDERQWWLASKLQDTFHFSGYDNPSLLEDFLSDYDVSELISKFLGPNGPRKLFFFCETIESIDDTRTPSLSNRQLQVTSQPTKDMLGKAIDGVCLYVLRRGMYGELDISQMDAELYCGEIRHSVLVNLSTLLFEAYTPLLHKQQDWGRCTNDDHSSFLQMFDRLTSSIHDNATQWLSNEQNLPQPSARLRESLASFQSQHPGRAPFANEVVFGECEVLLSDWMSSIEVSLIEATDERLEDPFGLPFSEKQKWERKLTLLHSIVEQLKKRESTAIIAALAAGKSRLIKKWRSIDTQLTESFNTSKDRVWYLSTLQQHFDSIQSTNNIASISAEILPTLFQSIKQMDGLSRLYANTGYIAVLLKKVANLITVKCQELLTMETTSAKGEPLLWDIVSNPDSAHQLTSLLNDVVKLSSVYKNAVYSIKDVLLHQVPYSKQHRQKQVGKPFGKPVNKSTDLQTTTNSSTTNSSIKVHSTISLSNVDEILESLFELSDRTSKVLDIILQVKKLILIQPTVIGLPRASGNRERQNEENDELENSFNGGNEDNVLVDVPVSVMEPPSIAETVSVCVSECVKCVSEGCPSGSREVFVTHGKDKTVFPLVYLKYRELIETFEEAVSEYLLDIFPHITESSRGLDILHRFSPISHDNKALMKAVHQCNMRMLRVYGTELDWLKHHYEEHKESPPLPRGQSRIGGAIEWARRLLNRIQGPMDTFRDNDALMKTPDSHHICALYNKLSTVLLQYEVIWLKQFRLTMDKTSTAWMSAPLLRLQECGAEKMTKIIVNSDNGLLQLLAEARSLMRLGAPLSPSAKALLSQEERVKSFEQRLTQVVGDLYVAIDSIDSRMRPLFEKMIEIVLRFFLPGWTTLTWATLNIDAFLYQTEMAVDRLRAVVERSNEVVTRRVVPVFNEIADTVLLDEETITGRDWDPDEFCEVGLDSIDTQAADVLHKATTCKTALLEVVSVVTQTEEQLQRNLEEHSNAMAKSSDFIKINRDIGTAMDGADKPIRSFHSTLSRLHEDKILLVLGRFSSLMNNSVEKMVVRSYSLFCRCFIAEELTKTSDKLKQKGSSNISAIGSSNISQTGPGSVTPIHSLTTDTDCQYKRMARIRVSVQFRVPNAILQPSIESVYSTVSKLLTAITELLDNIQPWVGVSELDREGEQQSELIVDTIHTAKRQLKQSFEGLEPCFNEFVHSLEPFKLLWQEDLNRSYESFSKTTPNAQRWREKINEFVEIERKVQLIPLTATIGPLAVMTHPLKTSLEALASNWKIQFTTQLHQSASLTLASVVEDQQSMLQTLSTTVVAGDLSFLREVLELLLHIDDMFHHVDEIYSPVEEMYSVLRSFDLVLPRTESDNVDELRTKWEELMQLATKVSNVLLTKERLIHEQECGKAVKEFVVETIKFRNAFDTEGPLVPGLIPAEAVSRVGSFLSGSEDLQSKRELLDAVQGLLSVPNTPYPELDHTQEELSFLKALYNNYQNFIAFDETFRQTLWSDVDLVTSLNEVNSFWEVFLSLPPEQQNWEASHKLRIGISDYKLILPVFMKLHSQEIRNRHWLQVMNVAGCNFQLDSRIFKMEHLIDADLQRFSHDIETIISNARQELELEKQFLAIEEEWSEQVLQFQSHSHTSIPLLCQGYTLSLMEQLDSTQTDLTVMLMSRHIQPLRTDCAQWAGKLGHVAEVLQVWLNVQELWLSLQPVFSNKETAMDYPDEAVVFTDITVTWRDLMNNAETVKGCIQVCHSSEEPVLPILLNLTANLEHCKKSLSAYLMEKRLVFPRLFYMPDDGLLTLLSNSESVQFVAPYLRSLFGGVCNLVVSPEDPLAIVAVVSAEGEELQLAQTVQLSNDVEIWLSSLLSSTRLTIQQLLLQAMDSDLPSLEEIVLYDMTQVACASLYQQWNKDCEVALSSCRYDRRALPGLRNKFNSSVVSKLNALLTRNNWKHSEEPVTSLQRCRLENMVVLSLWLRDIIDDLCQRKLREADDFEWRRFPRLIPHVSADGEQELKLHILDIEVPYYNEYLGCQQLPVFSPKTDAYFISLKQALQNGKSSCIALPQGSSKTELLKGVSYLIGQNVVSLHCTATTQTTAIANYLTGLAQDGSWVCFCNVHLLSMDGLSVLALLMDTVSSAVRRKEKSVMLPHNTREVSLSCNGSVFLTHSLSWTPPSFLSPLLRTFSIPLPDTHLCLRTHCLALGLKGARVLISRLESLISLVNSQMSVAEGVPRVSVHAMCRVLGVAARRVRAVQATLAHLPHTGSTVSKLDVTMKATPALSPLRDPKSQAKVQQVLPPPLPAGVIRDHTIVAEVVSVLLGSGFSKQELPVFQSYVKDTFYDCPDVGLSPRNSVMHSVTTLPSMKSLLETHAGITGLTCYENWMDKVEQLYLSLKTNHTVTVAGNECTGKTSALRTVIAAMNSRDNHEDSFTIKLHTIYSGVFVDVKDVFGYHDESGNWRDGLFTSLMRKSIKATHTCTWVHFDGALIGEWTDPIGQLTTTKTLNLSNGELLPMNTDTMKLVFETSNISTVTPALLSHSGLVYFDSADLSWRALASSWLKSRTRNEANCLEKIFEAVMDPVVDFILHKSDSGHSESEVALFETCLSYLSSLLDIYTTTAEVFSDVHVERLFLFSITWSYGGVLLREKDTRRFSVLLRQLSNSLPDDDTDYSVFDYYVDESGEWDVWQTKLPETRCQGVDLFGGVFVETATSIRIEMLLELALISRRHVLLVGPTLGGKTATLNHFLAARALHYSKSERTKCIVFNGSSTATDLHHFMQVHLKHRQGYTYGPQDNQHMHLMIEDLHVSQDCSSTTTEYLRSVIDGAGMYNLNKQNQWNNMEDLLVFATMTSDRGATLDPRLKRHFCIIPVASLSENDLADVIPFTMKGLAPGGCASSSQSLSLVSSVTLELYGKVKDALVSSDVPGRHHYTFPLHQLGSSLQVLTTECDDDSVKAIQLWAYEMYRTFVSPICRHGDVDWLNRLIEETIQDHIDSKGACPLYSSISPTVQPTKEPSKATPLSTMPSIVLHPLSQWSQLEESVSHYMSRYQEDVGSGCGLEINETNIMILERLHRTLKHARGNCVLVGSLGQPTQSLAQLALYIAGYTEQQCLEDTCDYRQFTDALKGVFRQAGLEGTQVGLILKDCHLENPSILGMLNSLISSCELPTLFSSEEMEGLYHALLPTIKRDFPSEPIDPEQYFAARICQNLRLVLCISPNNPLLGEKSSWYPGILHQSHTIWIPEWTSSHLHNVVTFFLQNSQLTHCLPQDNTTFITDVLSNIHLYVLKQSGTLTQAGVQPALNNPTNTSQSCITGLTPFDYLIEKMQGVRSPKVNSNKLSIPYIGPTSLVDFMKCLCRLYRRKNTELTEERASLTHALSTLESVTVSVKDMESSLDSFRHQLSVTSQQSSSLLRQLIATSCQLERARALCGPGGVVLSAMRMVSEQKRQMSENEENDYELLSVFYDRLPQKSSRIDAMMEKARQELIEAENEEKLTKDAMMKTKEQAHYWQHRIDRNTIDQIKSLPSPPALVGVVMELMLSLLKRYGVDSAHSQTSNESLMSPAVTRRKISTMSVNSKMERDQWGQLQLAIGDSQRFLDLINSLKWENGLHKDAIKLIESKLATSRNSRSSNIDSNVSTSDSVTSRTSHTGLVTVSMAKHAAESAASMCGFAVAIVEYQYSFEPYRLANLRTERLRKQLKVLEQEVPLDLTLHQSKSLEHPELSDVEEEEESDNIEEDEVRRLERELSAVQDKFDKAMMEKHGLSSTCEELTVKLKLARNLLEGLKPCQEVWSERVKNLPSVTSLLLDCTVSAAMLTYGGAMPNEQRSSLFETVMSLCVSEDGMSPSLTYSSLPSFLLSPEELYHLSMEGLPVDDHTHFNACIITTDYSSFWPLIVDPLGMVEQWLNRRHESGDTAFVKYEDLHKGDSLVQALSKGVSIVVTEVVTETLFNDPILLELLQNKSAILWGRHPYKIKINDTEVECSRNFRLLLITDDCVSSIPTTVASMCSVTLYQPNSTGIAPLLLDEFLSIHNEKTFSERQQLKQEIFNQIQQKCTLEKQLLNDLRVHDGDELQLESKNINRLLAVGKSLEFSQDVFIQRSRGLYEMNLSSLVSLSRRAAIIMDCVFHMVSRSTVYKTRYQYTLKVFKTFVGQAGSRIQSENILSNMTKFGVAHFEKGYAEMDRELFLVLTAIQIKINQGNLSLKEHDFLLAPSFGSSYAVKGLINQPVNDTVPIVNFGKKPFDWMSEKQWQMLLMLASNFEWVHSLLSSMGKDGKETVWRSLSEGSAPETLSLVDMFGQNKLTLTQQLLLQCVFRRERIAQFLLVFAAVVLDQKPLMPKLYEFQGVLRSALPGHTPLVIYDTNPEILLSKLQHYAQKRQVPFQILKCFGCVKMDADLIHQTKHLLAANKKQWILLHDIHLSEKVMFELVNLLHSIHNKRHSEREESGRLWVSLNKDAVKTIPRHLLQLCHRVMIDSPTTPISLLTHILLTCGELAIINTSPRPEWLPLIHNIAMFHIMLKNRRKICWWSVGEEYNWKHSHLLDILLYASKEFSSSDSVLNGIGGYKPVSWSGLRYMITEVVYGGVVTGVPDMMLLTALADYWLHPGGPRKEQGLYHIPSTFYTPNTRPVHLIQAIETTTPPLVPSAELCGIHFTSEMELGRAGLMTQSLISIGNDIRTNMSKVNRKTNKTPTAIPRGTSIALNTTAPRHSQKSVTASIHSRVLDKLPTTIPCAYNLLDLHLDSVSPELISVSLADVVAVTQQLKIALLTTVNKLLDAFPAGWKKEALAERLSRYSLESPFTLFLMKETERLYKCLITITTDLQHLQTALHSSTNKYLASFIGLPQIATSLLLLQTPLSWRQLVGPTSPSVQWSLQEWLNDVSQRFVFMDKLLSWGMERTPTYWLGAFFNPTCFLSAVFQSSVAVGSDQNILIADLTTRDKDHIRDPPQDGLFIYGLYLWGTHFEKSTNLDLADTSPRSTNPSPLPIVHLTIRSSSAGLVSNTTTENKPPYVCYSPCYLTRSHRKQPSLFHVKVISNDTGATKWSLRNMFCTLRPF